jgi:hypothetical protein
MFTLPRSRLVSFVWVFIPTLLWSLLLHSIILCIDSLLFPAIEQRVSTRVAFCGRLIWALVFTVALLWDWNIGPSTYLFYIREALPYTPRLVLCMIGLALVLLVWFMLASNISEKMGYRRAWVFSLGILLFFVKVLAATGVVQEPSFRHHIRSPVLGSAHLLFESITASSNSAAVVTPENTFYSFIQRDKPLPPRVVFMLVESWGETADALGTMARDINSQGFQSVKYGFTTYRGSTLSGEFRELCAMYVQPSNALMDDMENIHCAPQYLHDKGYQVAGLHGYQSSFYARGTFWTRFGIDNQVFRSRLQGEPQCPGPFPGVCDENLIRSGIDMLDATIKPAFVYMLTLSSHEPLDPAVLAGRGKYFNEIKVVHQTQVVTRRAISALVSRLQERASSPCTLIYIVGDHQPPTASARGTLFAPGKVPYLSFTQSCPAHQ